MNRITFVTMDFNFVPTERSKNLHSPESIPIFHNNNDTNPRSNIFLVNYHTKNFTLA